MLGQAVPLAAGLLAIPIITRSLGDGRFGLLALMWTIIGYFSLLDLGLGRATTKFVAQALAEQDMRRVQHVAGFTAAGQAALGVVGGAALATVTSWVVTHLLRVPAELQVEAEQAFHWLALSVPFVVLSANLLALRVVACAVTAMAIRTALPGFRWELRLTRELVRPLLGYGGWVAVTNVVTPILTSLERFVLGSVAGLGAVAY